MHKNLNHFKVVGISHQLASVEVREKFALSSTDVKIIHDHLGKYTKGGFVLSTCNRTEIYFIAEQVESILTSWAELSGSQESELANYLYQYEGKEAIEYLFRVGTGLDSQILGDFQIIGQIKTAYQKAVVDGSANNKITRMIDVLLRTSKRVKNETNLSQGVASMSYAAVQHVGKLIDAQWQSKTALVYGAGKMGTAVVRKLSEIMPNQQVMLANRTSEKAAEIAEKYEVKNVSSLSLQEMTNQADIIISAPTVKEPLFSPESLENINLSTKIFVDLSMPRSIHPDLATTGATVINLDYLQDIQNDTFLKRKESIPQAREIVKEELTEFYQWIKQTDLAPTIHALKEKLHLIKEVEMNKLKKENQDIDEAQIDQIAQALINKVTTQCVKHVKKHNGSSLNLITEIFELEQNQ